MLACRMFNTCIVSVSRVRACASTAVPYATTACAILVRADCMLYTSMHAPRRAQVLLKAYVLSSTQHAGPSSNSLNTQHVLS